MNAINISTAEALGLVNDNNRELLDHIRANRQEGKWAVGHLGYVTPTKGVIVAIHITISPEGEENVFVFEMRLGALVQSSAKVKNEKMSSTESVVAVLKEEGNALDKVVLG